MRLTRMLNPKTNQLLLLLLSFRFYYNFTRLVKIVTCVLQCRYFYCALSNTLYSFVKDVTNCRGKI